MLSAARMLCQGLPAFPLLHRKSCPPLDFTLACEIVLCRSWVITIVGSVTVLGPRLELISCKAYTLVYSLSPAPQGNLNVILKISSNNEKKMWFQRRHYICGWFYYLSLCIISYFCSSYSEELTSWISLTLSPSAAQVDQLVYIQWKPE